MRLFIDYLSLCWFGKDPLQLVPTQSFFIKNILLYLTLGIVVEANISDPADATLEISMETFVTIVLVSSVLFVKKQLYLFKQLLTALIAAENFIFVLGIMTEALDMLTRKTEYEDYPEYIGFFLAVWLIAIIAVIFKKTFQYETLVSVLLSIAYIVLTFLCPFLFMEVI